MDAVVFVLKSFVVTIAILFLMQIRVGNSTVERKTLAWMRQSVVVDGLRYVADGAVSITSKGYKAAHALVSSPNGSSPNGSSTTAEASRGYSWEIKRSDAYTKQEAKKKELEKAFNEETAAPDSSQPALAGPTSDEVD